MAKEISTEIRIDAKAEKVWSILTNFDSYPAWNPFIKSVQGTVKVGSRLKIRIEPQEGSGMNFKPEVLEYAENKKLRWLGKLWITGLFDGEHSFELIPQNDSTVFKQCERFTGLFVFLFGLSKTQKGFEQMNLKLKELAEYNEF